MSPPWTAARSRTSEPEQFFNNVFISQGNGSITTPSCDQQTGDTINVNCTTVTSDMTLEQGEGDEAAGLDLGANFINIATTSPVFVGDSTVINEIGANNGDNTIIIGGIGGPDTAPPSDFETGYPRRLHRRRWWRLCPGR